jgi:hypothetical protein
MMAVEALRAACVREDLFPEARALRKEFADVFGLLPEGLTEPRDDAKVD